MKEFLKSNHKIDDIKRARPIRKVWTLLDSLSRNIIWPKLILGGSRTA